MKNIKTLITLIFLLSTFQSHSSDSVCKVNYSSSEAVQKAHHFLGVKGLINEYIIPEESTSFVSCEWLVYIKPAKPPEANLWSHRVILVNKTTGKAKWRLFK